MTLTGVTVRTTEAKRGREGEEAGASPREGPLGRGETGWMMTSWWTDLTVRTTLLKRRNCRYPGSFWGTRPAKGVAGVGPMTQIATDQGRRRGRLCRQLNLTEVTLWTTREEEEQ